MLGHVLDVLIIIGTALLCTWSVHSYACATRGANTEAKAAAKKHERRKRIERWREERTWDNFAACLFVKVDPSVYRAW